jgi:hypothetical protein
MTARLTPAPGRTEAAILRLAMKAGSTLPIEASGG